MYKISLLTVHRGIGKRDVMFNRSIIYKLEMKLDRTLRYLRGDIIIVRSMKVASIRSARKQHHMIYSL